MAVYRTKCGLYFKSSPGSSFYLGESWGEEYGKEITHCPKHFQEDCEFSKSFCSRFTGLLGDCDGVMVPESEYDYEKSREKIIHDYDAESYRKILEKFGGNCMAIKADGRGGFTVKRDELSCLDCWNEVCTVTNKKRDLTKVKLMADIVVKWTEHIGFLSYDHKNLIRKKVIKNAVPLEFAERLLRDPDNLIFGMFKTNNCNRLGQMLGLEPPSEVVRFYYELSRAKRNLLDDLRAVAEGYNVIHEFDVEKQQKEAKKAKKEARETKKKEKFKKNVQQKRNLIEQISLIK